jgi:hypothetical protein
VYLLAHVLHDLTDEEARALLRRIGTAMHDSSVLVILAAAKNDVGTHLLAAYLDVQQMLLSRGRERTAAEYGRLLAESGLRPVSGTLVTGRPGIQILRARRPGTGEG